MTLIYQRLKQIFYLVLIFLAVLTYHYFFTLEIGRWNQFSRLFWKPGDELQEDLLGEECRVPPLIPFEPSVIHLVSKFPERLVCHDKNRFPFLFNSSVVPYPHLIPVLSPKEMEELDIKKCFYRNIVRKTGSRKVDFLYKLESTHFPVSFENATRIPEGHDFIAILCSEEIRMSSKKKKKPSSKLRVRTIKVDLHAFVHDQIKNDKMKDKVKDKNKLNVIILGLDAVSRMAFLRSMPDSYEYLKSTLDAVEMTAYHKIGDNTFPNIGPMLTNLPAIDESKLPCEKARSFDSCPFIWNQYSQAGYATLFAEDESTLPMFNLDKLGFHKPPTDYYLRPYLTAAANMIAHRKAYFTKFCYGPRPAFQVALDYMQKMTYVMTHEKERKRNYFQFMWSTSVTHDVLNGGSALDEYLRNGLEWWNTGGYLNDTVLILMSDHGARVGDMHKYYKGQLEDRLPFMFVVVPPIFKERYPQLVENLRGNQQRLVTVLDVHATLVHILNLEDVSFSWKPPPGQLTNGISLFNEIPLRRTCRMAGVADVYCTCNHEMKNLSVLDNRVQQAANYAVYSINRRMAVRHKCAFLSLSSVFQAGKVRFGESRNKKTRNGTWEGFQISFQTSPGNATFEGLISWDRGKRRWSVSGQIGRTNLYGNQSHCVHDKRARLYCYCLDLLDFKHPLTNETVPVTTTAVAINTSSVSSTLY